MIRFYLRSLAGWLGNMLAEAVTGIPTRACEHGCEFTTRCGYLYTQHLDTNHAGDRAPAPVESDDPLPDLSVRHLDCDGMCCRPWTY